LSLAEVARYRAKDVEELQRLVDAAALAFAHSVAYERKVEAEQLNLELYQALDQAQVEVGAQIARNIHGDLVNDRLGHNIIQNRGLSQLW
jgi:hypothetical protein